MHTEIVRVLRTPSSERFLLRRGGVDNAALDVHYSPTGGARATLIVFEGAGITESEIPELLTHIDDVLLPDASLDDHTLEFTVVSGRVLGTYVANLDGDGE